MDRKFDWAGLMHRMPAVVLAVALVFCSCETAQRKPLPVQHTKTDENILKVGVSPNTPPIIFKQGVEIAGLEADLARGLAAHLGKEVRFIEVPWGELINRLQNKRIDIIMSGMSITQGRRYRFAFSDAYYKTGLLALFRSEDRRRFREGWEDSLLEEEYYLNIGVEKGTVAEKWVRDNLPELRLVPYMNPAKSAGDLQYGLIDIFVHDAPVIYMLAAENEAKGLIPSRTFLQEYAYAWGFRKDSQELISSANAYIETIRKNGRLDALIKQWIPK